MNAEKRLETIRRAFGVEDYKKAIENATRISSLIKTRSAVIQERFRNVPELQSSIDKLKREIANDRKKEVNLVQKKKEKDGEKTTIIKKRNDLTEKNSKKKEIGIRKDNSKEFRFANKKSPINPSTCNLRFFLKRFDSVTIYFQLTKSSYGMYCCNCYHFIMIMMEIY